MPTTNTAEQPPEVHQPKHPTHALTTFELRDHRRELEHAITFYDTTNPVPAERDHLQAILDEVIAEQESRDRITRA